MSMLASEQIQTNQRPNNALRCVFPHTHSKHCVCLVQKYVIWDTYFDLVKETLTPGLMVKAVALWGFTPLDGAWTAKEPLVIASL